MSAPCAYRGVRRLTGRCCTRGSDICRRRALGAASLVWRFSFDVVAANACAARHSVLRAPGNFARTSDDQLARPPRAAANPHREDAFGATRHGQRSVASGADTDTEGRPSRRVRKGSRLLFPPAQPRCERHQYQQVRGRIRSDPSSRLPHRRLADQYRIHIRRFHGIRNQRPPQSPTRGSTTRCRDFRSTSRLTNSTFNIRTQTTPSPSARRN